MITTAVNDNFCVERTQLVGLINNGNKVEPSQEKKKLDSSEVFDEPTDKAIAFTAPTVKPNIEEIISKQRPINVPRDQVPFVSRAGRDRIDLLKMHDRFGNAVRPNLNNLSFTFALVDSPELCIDPRKRYSEEGLVELSWKPIVRGRYHLIINQLLVRTSYDIIVGAAEFDMERTRMDVPKTDKIAYHQEITIFMQHFDHFGNIYADIENKLDPGRIKLETESFRSGVAEPSKNVIS